MAIQFPSPEPGLPEIWQELQALRREVAELRRALSSRTDIGPPAPETQAGAPPLVRQSSAATLLARRNPERLQEEVRRRMAIEATSEEQGANTEVDLLIDRLHDLADASSPQP
jgi:hypothetical protein